MKKSQKKDRHKQKTVSFRLPEWLIEQIRELAEHNRRTYSAEVQIALEDHLAENGYQIGGQVSGKQ